MSSINFSGLASGLDTASIVRGLVNASRGPITKLEKQKSQLKAQRDVFNTIKTALADLRSKATAMDTEKEFASFSATTSDSAKLEVAAGAGANEGTFSVVVDRLAQNQRTYSDSFAAKNQTGLFGAGTIAITVGAGAPVEIAVDGATTLESLSAAINSSDAAVNASVFFDGTSYRLQVTGQQTGAANQVTFVETGTTLGLTTLANTIQQAQDARIFVDSFTVTSATNTINDAVAGVTIKLKEASASAVTIGVAPDKAKTQQRIEEFVASLNTISSKVAEQFRFSGTADASRLSGDSALMSLQRDMANILSGAIVGASGSYSSLSEIGIETQRDGTIKIDTAKLTAALDRDPSSVNTLFTSDPSVSRQGSAEKFKDLVDRYTNTVDGRLTVRSKGIDRRVQAIDKDITRQQTRLDDYQERLQKQFNALERLMTQMQRQSSTLQQQLNTTSQT